MDFISVFVLTLFTPVLLSAQFCKTSPPLPKCLMSSRANASEGKRGRLPRLPPSALLSFCSPRLRRLSLSLCRAQAVINTMCGFGVQTQKYLDADKLIYPVGCADRAVLWIESHLLLVGALALGLALPQVPKYRCMYTSTAHT